MCLGGTGQLSAANENISYNSAATALFQQTGGTNAANTLAIGTSGRYLFSGGTLQIGSGGLSSPGRLRRRGRHGHADRRQLHRRFLPR